jgi:LPS sulfotransferase NodH
VDPSPAPGIAVEGGAVRFVIVAARRTGSNLLCTLLDSHSAILCHHELFNPRGIFYARSLRHGGFDLGSAAERDANPEAFLDRVWRHPRGHRCVGFKVTNDQADTLLEHVLADSGVRKIVLERRNRVKTYVSERLAEQLDEWEVYDEADLTSVRPRVVVDVQDLRSHVARNERFYQHVGASLTGTRQGFLRICYEELRNPPVPARLLRFLGVAHERVVLQPGSVKQNPRDLREIVANFEQLAEALRGDPLREELLDLES